MVWYKTGIKNKITPIIKNKCVQTTATVLSTIYFGKKYVEFMNSLDKVPPYNLTQNLMLTLLVYGTIFSAIGVYYTWANLFVGRNR